MSADKAIDRGLSLDLATLANARAHGVSAWDLLATVYGRIERADHPHVWTHLVPRRQAFAALEALEAKQKAGADLPLFGATFAVKDNIDVAHMPTTAACPAFAYTPERSAPVVQRLLDAGALCLGKTNMDQFATGLVGTRSPYGACRNVFDPQYIAGGSSSGSAVAVAAGWVSFALGTDTAGSGRVPAALNNIVGLKPTPGLLPTAGVVPACKSLDCVSVFALTSIDAQRVRDVMRGPDRARPIFAIDAGFTFATPELTEINWRGDDDACALFARAMEEMRALGGRHVEINWAPFAEAGELLYNGPWIAERAASVGDFVASHRHDCLPVIVEILSTAQRFSAADAFAGMYRLEELRALASKQWRGVDVLLLPTVISVPTLAQVATDPRASNDRLGVYTRFANLLGCSVTAVPSGMRANGLPFGVSLVAPAGCDHVLDALALRWQARLGGKLGATAQSVPPLAPSPEVVTTRDTLPIAVVGAHLSGMPLNHQLTDRGATLARTVRTSQDYRLYALPNTEPRKPGLMRVHEGGAAIELEVWRMPVEEVGGFLACVPPPLVIGNIELEDGAIVKGFLCEPHAIVHALDITAHGGFRRYVASLP